MKSTSAFSLLTLIAIAVAAKTFSVITIRSGSEYQYASLNADNGAISVGASGDNTIQFILNDDGSLVDHNTGKYVSVSNSQVVESDTASHDIAISEYDHLVYKGKEVFTVDNGKLAVDVGTGVALKLVDEQNAANYYPQATQTTIAPTTLATKTTTTTAGAKTTTAAPAPKPDQAPSANNGAKFGLISIASGTQFQNAAIKKVDSHPHVFSVGGSDGKDVVLTLQSDGSLVDQDGRGIYLDTQTGELGNVAPFGRQAATKGFSINDGHLLWDGKDNWKACPSGPDTFSLANNDCIGGTGIVLHVVSE